MTQLARNRLTWSVLSIIVFAGLGSVAQDIDLPRLVPAFNQAYTEGPGAWGNCLLGTVGCPDQVCTTGCLVTAFSSVLAYFGVEVSVPARSSCTGEARSGMDPGIFNDWLREFGGYGRCAQDPVGNCCLIWEQLPVDLEITTHVNRNDIGLNPVSAVVIDHALRQGHLVVAGVHWGSSCNGGSTQTEDCHWVILTGKRNGTYTIVDPYNPDPTSPYGVRTTLDAGVHGSYIIDRFVVVVGPSVDDLHLEVQVSPLQASYRVGDPIRLAMVTPRSSGAFLPFARVTTPSGQIAYVVLDGADPSRARYSATRQSLVPDPRSLTSEWTWHSETFSAADVGRWSWEVWVERSLEPGTKIGRQTISYEVTSANETSPLGAAVLGILLVVAIAAIAFISTLQTGIE
ncbi:hypothetical protein IH601_00470 [Candidatus Bipolaricaulota bacterium]|nr:hypothetical protein [Candidatus Bipolaricaulota bacterium]TFH09449.1 MAG: hypothetical protein E4H08_05745 [Candidatus Atribacteria bacterium]